jgi:predicted esterase
MDAAHMREDEDLETLRKEKQFEELVAKAEATAKSVAEKLYDKGEEIPGVKTVEGNPAGGLRWRLRMSPTATAEKPNRLIIWLHPSGGSMNRQAEGFSAEFNKRGFALLVPTMKQWVSWSTAELTALMNVTVRDAAKTPGIEPHKPILMGYSAGGQGALMIYKENAKNLGGLILDAAYPIDQAKRGLWSPPQDEEKLAPFKKVPLFVLVGEQDNGSQVWKAAEKQWGEQGLPLTLTIVPGQKHTWLFGPSQTEALYTWLEQVAKGELPGAKKAEKAH